MAAGSYDFVVYQGDTLEKTFEWRDKNQTLVPLTGYTARMQVRSSADSDDVVLEMTTEDNGITLTNPGQIVVSASAEEMAEVAAGSYKYDLEMVTGDGFVRKLLVGKFKVLAEVTR